MALQSTTALATVTLQAATPTVTFSGIPNSYRDLILSINIDGNSSGFRLRVNNDTGSNYFRMGMVDDPNPGSFANTSDHMAFVVGGLDNGAGNLINATFFDYSATDKHTTALARSGAMPLSEMGAYANRWANTEAINSITMYTASGSWDIGSTFSLYGRIA